MWRFGKVLVATLTIGFSGVAFWPAESVAQTTIVIEPSENDPAAGPAGEAGAKPAEGKGDAAKADANKDLAGGDKAEKMRVTFAEFCATWVEKLRERERHNLSSVKWEPVGENVVAEYVGYDTNNIGPQTVAHVDTTPIGKLIYLELKLRRTGKSKEDALTRDPEIVERTEVTELFRFNNGVWVY